MARWSLSFVLFFLIPSFTTVRAEWVPLGAPEGGRINQIAVVPGSPGTAYAATGSGLFKTTDSGTSWRVAGPASEVESVAVDPIHTDTVYASDLYTGFWKSTDGGDRWTFSDSLRAALFLAPHPVQANTLLALTRDAIVRSTDGGASWDTVHWEGYNANQFLTLSFSPVAPHYAYATTNGQGIYRSTDGGVVWARAVSPTRFPQSLAVDPVEPAWVYSGDVSAIRRSTDAGQTWTGYLLNKDVRQIFDLLAVPGHPGSLYATTDLGVFRSPDHGAHWESVAGGLPPPLEPCRLAAPPGGQVIYVGSYGLGIYRSTDGGAQWNRVNSGLRALAVQAVLQNGGAGLYVGTRYGGVYRSTDNGRHWNEMNRGLNLNPLRYFARDVRSLVSDPVNRLTIYAGTYEGIFKSTDGGENWAFSGNGMPNLPHVTAIVTDRKDSRILNAGSEVGLFRTMDGGDNWTQAKDATGAPLGRITALTVNPTAPYEIYAGDGRTLYKSADSGATWQSVYTPIYIDSIAIDPRSPGIIYAGVDQGLQKSTDGGKTWANFPVQGLSNLASIAQLAFDPVDPGTLFAAVNPDGGIYRSTDGGMTWSPFNVGLRNLRFSTVAAEGRRIYAGTANGLYVLRPDRTPVRRAGPSGR